MLGNPRPRAMLNLRRQSWLRASQRIHTDAQPERIERVDDEGPMTTLCAALPTDQPVTRALRRLSERGIHNLHQ
jgi:hypothetical protein